MTKALADKRLHGVIRANEHRPVVDPQYIYEASVEEVIVTEQPGHTVISEFVEALSGKQPVTAYFTREVQPGRLTSDSLSVPFPLPPALPSAKVRLAPRDDVARSAMFTVTGRPGTHHQISPGRRLLPRG